MRHVPSSERALGPLPRAAAAETGVCMKNSPPLYPAQPLYLTKHLPTMSMIGKSGEHVRSGGEVFGSETVVTTTLGPLAVAMAA